MHHSWLLYVGISVGGRGLKEFFDPLQTGICLNDWSPFHHETRTSPSSQLKSSFIPTTAMALNAANYALLSQLHLTVVARNLRSL